MIDRLGVGVFSKFVLQSESLSQVVVIITTMIEMIIDVTIMNIIDIIVQSTGWFIYLLM